MSGGPEPSMASASGEAPASAPHSSPAAGVDSQSKQATQAGLPSPFNTTSEGISLDEAISRNKASIVALETAKRQARIESKLNWVERLRFKRAKRKYKVEQKLFFAEEYELKRARRKLEIEKVKGEKQRLKRLRLWEPESS